MHGEARSRLYGEAIGPGPIEARAVAVRECYGFLRRLPSLSANPWQVVRGGRDRELLGRSVVVDRCLVLVLGSRRREEWEFRGKSQSPGTRGHERQWVGKMRSAWMDYEWGEGVTDGGRG
jgi:hypothetical protein